MPDTARILIVEDEMIIAATIQSMLTKLGYEVVGINTRGEEALRTVEADHPDLVLMDIALRGDLDGIEVADQIQEKFQVPVIYVTANVDDSTFQRAKATKPAGFIAKPFREADLRRAIELALAREGVISDDAASSTDVTTSNVETDASAIVSTLDDRLFIRHGDQMVKVRLEDILFVEADRTYCKMYTVEREYILSIPLANLEKKLPEQTFIRTHRSYLVNLTRIDAISEHREYVTIADKTVPVSRRMKDDVVRRLRMV